MANKIKNNSTQGLYITEEENGQIANDTPGEIDLDNLVLGDSYIYFDIVSRFEEKATFNKEGDDWTGFKTWQRSSSDLSVEASTGGAMRVFYLCTVETNLAGAQFIKRLSALNVFIGDGIKYIVKQNASESFETFPNDSATLRKATPIIIRGYDIVELGNPASTVKMVNFACERITARN